nr:Asp-tRNA(Asn)/Glu-tRNA(Gln) amidotransferase GatCAB subunit B [Candidatus Gracilibacteria bacterium]
QSFLQRSKENAADYRYFPEPDLPPYLVKEEQIARISQDLVELPRARYLRFMKDYELPAADAFLLTEDRLVADYYEAVLKQANFPKKVANWILSELFAYLKADQKSIGESLIKPGHLAELILLIEDDIISGKIAKSIFPEMYQTGKNPTVIVDDNGLRQNSNIAELESICQEIIQSNPQIVSDYKAGKTRLFGALIGQVMKKTQGQANPGLVNEILLRYLQ